MKSSSSSATNQEEHNGTGRARSPQQPSVLGAQGTFTGCLSPLSQAGVSEPGRASRLQGLGWEARVSELPVLNPLIIAQCKQFGSIAVACFGSLTAVCPNFTAEQIQGGLQKHLGRMGR